MATPSGMPRQLAVFFFSLFLFVGASAHGKTPRGKAPTNPDKGEIVLAGVVLTPGEGDGTGLAPLPGVLVVIEGTKHATTTDGRGLFIFTEAPEGQVTLVITREGYQTVKRTATVDKGVEEPPTLRVEMLRVGAEVRNGVYSGSGTLYATYLPRVENSAGSDGDFTNLMSILAMGVDPLTLAVARPPTDQFDPKAAMEMFPTTEAACHVMVRPSEAPSRTTFHEMGSVPVWPCFDKTGRYLYVSTVYQHRIEIFDVTKGNEAVANVPTGKVFLTSLTLSPDGRYLYATQMGLKMGVLVVDTTSTLPVAFLDLPESTMIPNALACSADGRTLYLVLSNALSPGAAGQLIALDATTGQVGRTITVGATPTDVLLSPDGRLAVTVNSGSGNLSVVDLAAGSVVRTLPAEVSPRKAVWTNDGRIMVANKGSGTVSVLGLDGRIFGRIKVGKGPTDIVLGKDGAEAFVSNYEDGSISVIDVASGTVKSSVPPNSRSSPLGLTVRP